MKSYIVSAVICLCVLPVYISCLPEDPPLKSLRTGNVYLHFNCSFCEIGITAFKTLMKLHASDAFIAKTALEICKKFHIEDSTVCKGAVNAFKVRNLGVYTSSSLISFAPVLFAKVIKLFLYRMS